MEIFKRKKSDRTIERARQRSMFNEVLNEMDKLEEDEELTFIGKNRFDVQQIKRLAKKRFVNKVFDVYGKTESEGKYWVYISLITDSTINE